MTDKFNHDDNNINDSKNTEVFDFREVDTDNMDRQDRQGDEAAQLQSAEITGTKTEGGE